MHRTCKQAALAKREHSAWRGQIVSVSLLVALLSGCASVSDRVTFDALAETPSHTTVGSEPADCQVNSSAETAAITSPCQPKSVQTSSVSTPEIRQEVADALGSKYVTAPVTPPQAARQGSSSPSPDASLITGSINTDQSRARSADAPPTSTHSRPTGPISLADAVAHAVLTYPEIRAREAALREAKAGIDISRAAIMPNADLRYAYGGNYSGSFEGRALPYRTASTSVDNRFDGGLTLRLLLWDFGAASADIARARLLSDAESFRLREKIDEIAWRTSQTFVKVHEHRALIALVDETIASHQELLRIVMAQEQEGHGTSADVNRVRSRLTDISAIRADISLNLQGAEDQFERLTRYQPRRLGPVPNYRTRLPANPELAMSKVLVANPRLAAMQANNLSIDKELEAQRAGNLPRIGFEFDTESKNFRTGIGGRTQIEGRGMVSMRFKLLDGGLADAQERQIRARKEGGEMQLLNEREQLEADIRQAYRAIESAIRKGNLLGEGVTSARRVRELYLEQFKAGRRTIFELLDGQMAFYTARRAQIESQFEVNKAVIDVLRLTGELTRVLAGGHEGPSTKRAVANR
jgi:outer membrane protein TolC